MSNFIHRSKEVMLGKARDLTDPALFQKLSLIAFFAWVGLGADGLSSSCYGPSEAFLTLEKHPSLAIFVALATALTIFVISSSYKQIIELFPAGGGGYLVASKLLSPRLGMIAGCALLVDYVLTITISVASGADALFSFLPVSWHGLKLAFAVLGVLLLTVMNLRGTRESVIPLVPIFLTFVLTHAVAITYALFVHLMDVKGVFATTVSEVQVTSSQLGLFGMIFLILRAYSMGAGTFTGIEAVSNGLPILREPRVKTGKRTMTYMAVSLAVTVMGLMIAYLLFEVEHVPGKTLNAVLFDKLTSNWGNWGYYFVLVTLLSEAVLLFVAAQTGFLDGPRILANMALDRWVPTRFASLSDRLVTQNGILIMGAASLVLMVLAKGSVRFLVVLYSINVFITFFLSQLGMVRHWWKGRKEVRRWFRKLFVNGVGLVMTIFILISVIVLKFSEGGWITLAVTGSVAVCVILIKRHYEKTGKLLQRLDSLVDAVKIRKAGTQEERKSPAQYDPKSKTAVLLVNGFNGVGLHSLLAITRIFGDTFGNYVFLQVGVVDAGVFKGVKEMDSLRSHAQSGVDRYVQYMRDHGYYAEGISSVGTDVVEEVSKMALQLLERFPQAVFFGGQLVFPNESFLMRWLHNYTVFAIQRRFYYMGIPLVLMPIKI